MDPTTHFITVWLISAAVLLALAFAVRSLRLHHAARLKEIHWRGLIVIALVLALLPAFIAEQLSPRTVEVPAGVAEWPGATTSTPGVKQ